MKYIEKLLNGAEVKWMPLGEVCDFKNGFAFKSYLFKETGLPVIRISNINGKSVDMSDIKYFDVQDYHGKGNPLNYCIEKGDVLIAMSGATTGKIGYYDNEEKVYQNQRVGKFVPNNNILDGRFLYHFLQTKTQYLYNLAGGGAQPNLSTNDIKEKVLIPIPPLAVQEEITRILDKFTTLEAELEAELDCRKRQYEYYRNQLLSLDMLNGDGKGSNNVTWLSLGEVVNIKGRIGFRGYTQNDFVEEGCGAIALSPGNMNNGRFDYEKCSYISWEKYEESPEIKIFEDDIVFVKTGSTAGKLAYVHFVPEKATLNPQLVVFKDIKCNKRYLFHYLNTNSCQLKIKALVKGTIPNISQTALAKIQVPLPLPEEQQHIAEILDKFDILVTSISEGLPKEIELRRKQYEYYRNQLLSFA